MELKIIFPDGSEYEPLELTPLGDNLYRVEASIGPMVEPEQFIRYQDVVELELKSEREGLFRRIVQPSPYQTSMHAIRPVVTCTFAFELFSHRLLQTGGHWELVFGGLLMVHLKPGTDFDLDKELDQMSRSLRSASAL